MRLITRLVAASLSRSPAFALAADPDGCQKEAVLLRLENALR